MCLLVLALTAVTAFLAPAALAHNALISSNPAADSVLPEAPDSIELVFNQDVKDFQPKVAITITGHDPVEVVPMVDGPTVTADLSGLDLPGADSAEPVSWRVGYRVVSADGHPVTGLLNFSVGSGPAPTIGETAAGTETAGSAAIQSPAADTDASGSADQSTGISWWWIVGAVILAGLIGAGAILVRRRQRAGVGS